MITTRAPDGANKSVAMKRNTNKYLSQRYRQHGHLFTIQLLEPVCLFIMVGRYLELSINLSKEISIKSLMADWLRKSFVFLTLTLTLRDQFIFHLVRWHISEEGPLLLTVHMPSFNLIIAAGVLQIIFRKYLSRETLQGSFDAWQTWIAGGQIFQSI